MSSNTQVASAVETLSNSAPLISFETVRIGPDMQLCTICRENIRDPFEYLACGHLFCRDCIQGWTEVSGTPLCPNCRQTVVYTPIRTIDALVNWSRQRMEARATPSAAQVGYRTRSASRRERSTSRYMTRSRSRQAASSSDTRHERGE